MKATAAQYLYALRTCQTSQEAANKLGVSGAAVSKWRKKWAMEPLKKGPRALERVCPIHLNPHHNIPGVEFDRLFLDLGTCETAVVLSISESAVSQRALRRGLRRRSK